MLNNFDNKNYKYLYLKYKKKYIKLKELNNIKMIGGASFSLRITNGVDNFTVSGFSQLVKLKSIVKKKEGKNWFKISKLIDKYINKESYNMDNASVITVEPEEYIEIRKLAVSLNILLI